MISLNVTVLSADHMICISKYLDLPRCLSSKHLLKCTFLLNNIWMVIHLYTHAQIHIHTHTLLANPCHARKFAVAKDMQFWFCFCSPGSVVANLHCSSSSASDSGLQSNCHGTLKVSLNCRILNSMIKVGVVEDQ